jgi:hypothetical protein
MKGSIGKQKRPRTPGSYAPKASEVVAVALNGRRLGSGAIRVTATDIEPKQQREFAAWPSCILIVGLTMPLLTVNTSPSGLETAVYTLQGVNNVLL